MYFKKVMEFFWDFAIISTLLNFLIKETSFSNAIIFIALMCFFLVRDYLQKNKVNEYQDLLNRIDELNTKVQAIKLNQSMRSVTNGSQKNNSSHFNGSR